MTPRIKFLPVPGRMLGNLTDVPAFPGEEFTLDIPEVIGDASQVVQTLPLAVLWTELGPGRWRTQARVDGELAFVLALTCGRDTVDIRVTLTNLSTRTWDHTLAFHCFDCRAAPSIADFECVRHWARLGHRFRRLIELPRRFSPRPTVQFYNVQGASPAMQLPFVAQFQATPDEVLEGWLAIQSRDGTGLVAAASIPAIFSFQNMEYSCLHSAPGFGALQPGQTGEAWTRLYFVRASLHDWYRRMKFEMAS